MAEDRSSDGAGGEAGKKSAEGEQVRRQAVLVGKEQLAEHQPGGGAVKEEVVPLDGGANGGGDDGLAQLPGMICVRRRRCCGHGPFPRLRLLRLFMSPVRGFERPSARSSNRGQTEGLPIRVPNPSSVP